MVQNRPPIIVILGHVDHGKTTLLDYLRSTNIAAREAGGITQHIRSFQLVTKAGETMTFIDTPGHAAFSSMRSRGSKLADLAILVVSSDDGVMPQTKESIEFINQAKIPFIVALTKADLPSADPDRVKTQLAEAGVYVEDYGGNVPSVSVSAKTGAGIPELLEMISLVISLDPPQADPEGPLETLVLEGHLDPRKGPLCTVIVKSGTLSVGQPVFHSESVGKIRALIDPEGQQIKSALPSTPVEILGLTSVPPVGEVLSDRPHSGSTVGHNQKNTSADAARYNVILRADVVGSLEAILASFDPAINVVMYGTGDMTENDISLAKTSGARVIGFNVKVPHSVMKLAEVEKIKIHSYKIIYELLEDLDEILHPKSNETIMGKAEVAAEFKIGPDRIAGCRVTEGVISRTDQVRIERDGKVIGTTKFKNMQTGKTQIEKVKAGQECGVTFSPYLDFKVGDLIIAFQIHGSS